MQRAILPVVVLALLSSAVHAADPGEADYAAGLSALSKNKYGDAVKAFDKAVAANEDSGKFLEARGIARAFAQDLPGATADLKRSLKLLDPADWEGKGWLGVVNRMAGRFEEGFTPGLAPRADRDYALAMNDMGQNYGMSTTRGTYYDKRLRKTVQTQAAYTGDFADVAKMFVERHRGAGGADGTPGAAVLDEVRAMLNKKDYAGALAEMRPLMKASTEHPEILKVYGECLLMVGDAIEARKVYTQVLTLEGGSVDGYMGRDLAVMQMGDAQQAMKDLTAAHELDPVRVENIDKRIATLSAVKVEDPQNVLKELETLAMKFQDGVSQPQIDVAAMRLVKAMEGRRVRYDEVYQEMRGELETALMRDPKSAERMVELARFLYERAEVQGETVRPRGVEVKYRVQTEGMKAAEVKRAVELVDAALRADEKNVGAMTLKAEMLLDGKSFAEAEVWARRALAVKGNDPNLLELLAKLLEVDASYKITAAGNMRQPRDLFETRFDEHPPMIYHWTIYPTREELQQAGRYEREAQAFADLAMQTIGEAVKAGGRTEMGYYFDATTRQMTGDYAGAEELAKKALALNPKSQKALFLLAALYTDEKKGDAAVRARTEALNLSQTTDGPWLAAAWFKIPRGQVKGGREALLEAAAIDPADPRIWAYLAVLDEASGKREAALGHWTMARAVSEATLRLHGQTLGQRGPVPSTAEEVALAVMIRMRMALLELEDKNAAAAAGDFSVAAAALRAVDDSAGNAPLPGVSLPDPNLAAGVVPVAETLVSLRIRADAGAAYASWAAASKSPEDAMLAAETYRRMLVDRPLTMESMESFKAIADLGMAELHVKRGELDQARESMRNGAAVPQDFWQEMRKVQRGL